MQDGLGLAEGESSEMMEEVEGQMMATEENLARKKR